MQPSTQTTLGCAQQQEGCNTSTNLAALRSKAQHPGALCSTAEQAAGGADGDNSPQHAIQAAVTPKRDVLQMSGCQTLALVGFLQGTTLRFRPALNASTAKKIGDYHL